MSEPTAARTPITIEPGGLPSSIGDIVCLTLTTRGIGNRKKADLESVEVDCDKDRLGLTKKLFASPEIEAIGSLDAAFKKRILNTYGLSSPLQKPGMYMIKAAVIEDVDAEVQEFIQQRAGLVEQLFHPAREVIPEPPDFDKLSGKREKTQRNARITITTLTYDTFDEIMDSYNHESTYEFRCKESAVALGVMWSPKDFPPLGTLRNKYVVEHAYFMFDAPNRVKSTNPEFFRRQQQKIAGLWEASLEIAQQEMTQRYSKMLSHFLDRLQDGEDGKPLVFHHTLIDNAQAFFEAFPRLNFTSNAELEEYVKQGQALLKGVTTKDLKTSEEVRKTIREGMEQIQSAMDQMLVKKPGRSLDFEA